MKEKVMKKQKGITLVALAITIVILILLAIVSINSLFGENGIITSANKSAIEHTHASVWEKMEVEYSEYWENKINFQGDLIQWLQNKDIIRKEKIGTGYVINVEKLLGQKKQLGNGTDGINDVYKLEEITEETKTSQISTKNNIINIATTGNSVHITTNNENKKYRVKYYGESGDRILGILGDGTSSIIESDNPNINVSKEIVGGPQNGNYYKVGEKIHYKITVKNVGRAIMSDIYITDTLTSGEKQYKPGEGLELEENVEDIRAENGCWYIKKIDIGKTKEINYTYVVKEEDVGAEVKNVITGILGNPTPTIPKGEIPPEIGVPPDELIPTATGNLKIVKQLKTYNRTQGPATFVFLVEIDNGSTSFSKVVSFVFNTAEEQSIVIEGLPAGAAVTVTEVYSGGAYDTKGSKEQTTIIKEDQEVAVSFENDYNYKKITTNSITNHFSYNNGNWNWETQ